MKDFLMARLREQSTWKGLGWVLVGLGLLPVSAVPVVVSVGVGVVGLVEVVRKEKGADVVEVAAEKSGDVFTLGGGR